MKLLILSDSHGDTSQIVQAIDLHQEVEALIFLGDGTRDIDYLTDAYPQLRMYVVKGNCDLASFYPTEALAAFGGVNIFYTHGHLLGVKRGIDMLKNIARKRGADVALYGHTHYAQITQENDLLLFNPGTIGGFRESASYGILTIENGQARAEIWYL